MFIPNKNVAARDVRKEENEVKGILIDFIYTQKGSSGSNGSKVRVLRTNIRLTIDETASPVNKGRSPRILIVLRKTSTSSENLD